VARELHRDQYGTIAYSPEQGILELEWLEESGNMVDDDFMESMTRYAALAEEHRTPNMLVDVTRFRHSPGEQVPRWRDEHIIPRYNAAGVRKFAFLVPRGAPGTVESGHQPEKEPPGTFPTGYFEDRQHILEWFDS
jgi:hypothetical protein